MKFTTPRPSCARCLDNGLLLIESPPPVAKRVYRCPCRAGEQLKGVLFFRAANGIETEVPVYEFGENWNSAPELNQTLRIRGKGEA